MKRIIDVDENLICEGFVRNFTEEEKDVLIRAIENGIPYEERPQGEWIIDGHHIRCNRCNEYICNTDREGNKIPDNFCPNCGSEMKGGAE